MSCVASDRWTCGYPGCGKTVVIDGSPDDVAVAIDAAQRRHATVHRKAAAERRRLTG